MPNKTEQLYEGKVKVIFKTDDPNLLIMYYKDDATAFNNKKKGTIEEKGAINNAITAKLYELLAAKGIPNHLVSKISDREMLVKKVEIIPVEVIIRNVVAGGLSKRLGIPEGTPLKRPIIEYCYKSDELDDPMINDDHILTLGYATDQELINIRNLALKVNDVLVPYFDALGIRLIDFKLEFGRHKGEVILADEITPDSCRLWDKKTNEKLDKDRFRRDLGKIEEAYQTILRKVVGE
ncbi:phosphoribosylaminoimidazolesuccinocarboxamide synthase [bacterium]|nr:phosphoribosylaminoimidazolesuccinocarboxamide synthase [bacterium]